MRETTGRAVRTEEADLFGLTGKQREAAIQGLLEQRPFPFVIVDDFLVCTGSMDTDSIIEAVRGIGAE